MKTETDSDRIPACASCGGAVDGSARHCAACGAEQPGRDCPRCHERVLISARFCGACGCPTTLEEAWVELTNAYDLVVDRFVDEGGVDQEQQVRARTVHDAAGVRQAAVATLVRLTTGIAKALDEGRLVRTAAATSEADSAISAPTEVTSSAPTGWRREMVHAFGLGGGPAVRQMQDAVAPDSVLGVAAIDERARLPRDPRTSLPREPAADERKW